MFPQRREIVLAAHLGSGGPQGRHIACGFLSRPRRIAFKWKKGWQSRGFSRLGRFDRLFGWFDQALSKPPPRRFGSIAAAFYREVGAFPVTTALRVSIAFPSPFAGPVLESWRRGGHRSGGWVAGLRAAGAAAIIAAAAASRLALPLAVTLAATTDRVAVRAFIAFKVLGLDVRDVEKAVTADREVDEPGLDCRLEVDDPTFVDVARVALVACSFHVKFFENAVFNNGDPAFLGLKYIDQHFFLHAVSFRDCSRRIGVGVRLGRNWVCIGLVRWARHLLRSQTMALGRPERVQIDEGRTGSVRFS